MGIKGFGALLLAIALLFWALRDRPAPVQSMMAPRQAEARAPDESAEPVAAAAEAPSRPMDHIPPARLVRSGDGRVLQVVGGIDKSFDARFRREVAAMPQLERIDVTSGGGLLGEALRASQWIHDSNKTVRVVRTCASACVALWAAATQRQMDADAVIGLHRYTGENGEDIDADNRDPYMRLLARAGFGDDVISWVNDTRNTDIRLLDYSYLMRSNIAFSVVDASGQVTWTNTISSQ